MAQLDIYCIEVFVAAVKRPSKKLKFIFRQMPGAFLWKKRRATTSGGAFFFQQTLHQKRALERTSEILSQQYVIVVRNDPLYLRSVAFPLRLFCC